MNNESNNRTTLKTGLTKLNRMVLIGGPDDGIISPWQSSQFGYYDKNDTILELQNRTIYQDDLIGLKFLDEQNKLKIITVPGIPHYEWHKNLSIVDQFLLPYLD